MASISDGFKLIAEYSSSSDENDDESNSRHSAKRQCIEKSTNLSKTPLPVPDTLLSMFGGKKECEPITSCNNNGRIRSFPHERGNWATYLYIPCEMFENPSCGIQLQKILNTFKSTANLNPVDHFHVSVSRTFVLQHHWIDPLVATLKKRLGFFTRFPISFQSVQLYTNEEKTRTFLGLQVDIGHSHLISVTSAVDACLQEFKLPVFYEGPSFHVSIAWCLGDKLCDLQQLLPEFQIRIGKFLQSQPNYGQMFVNAINMKTGNKTFLFRFENI